MEGNTLQETQLTMTFHRRDKKNRVQVRILFVHPNDELYGSDTVLLNIMRGLDRSKYAPYVLLANDLPYQGLLSAELVQLGIPTLHVPLAVARRKYLTPIELPRFCVRQVLAIRKVLQFIRKHDIDVVYSSTASIWSAAFAARYAGKPHIWHVHEIVERPTLLRWYLQKIVPRYSDTVICVSQATFDGILVNESARRKGIVLRNGLDSQPYAEATGRARVRTELGCKPGDIVIGFVGRISDFKAPDLLVQAAELVLRERPHARFFLAGDSVVGQHDMWDLVCAMIASGLHSERIHMLGYRKDVADLDAALDILAVTSRGLETCSLVSVQAMFSGKPVVATDVGAMRETVHDAVTGFIVPPEDAHAFAQALIRLVDNVSLRESMGRNASQMATRMFTLEQNLEGFHAILNQLA